MLMEVSDSRVQRMLRALGMVIAFKYISTC